jgi:PBP1b-binding outer membrane lipoprotein LpoB
MKKVIWLLPVMALFLVGCAGNKVKPEAKVVIQKVIEKKLPLSIANPAPLELDHIQWIIVTEENVDEIWQQIKDDNEGVALFALRHGDYESLAMNIAEIRQVIGEYVVILKQYKEYYEEK